MKTSWLLSVILFIAPLSAGAADWVDFTAEDGKFSASFPTEPTVKKQSIPTESGTIPHTTCVAELEEGAIAFGVAFNDYPDAVRMADPQKVLDSGRDGTLTNLKGKLISETPMTFEGYPAREFTVEGSVDGHVLLYHTRIILIDTRLYQMQIVRVGDAPVDIADAIRFFASFKPKK